MSRSPPPPWRQYPPQGSASGPPLPKKRSPERDRRSPGYDREAEWRRFQEWEKRNRKPSPRRSSPGRVERRPPSPRKDRSPPRGEWNRRSPPRPHLPPNWGRRSRSPQGWQRRSPPRYPPRGRSPPPRGRSPPRWGPPPSEFDRYRGYPPRRSPPRFAPAPPPPWDHRGGRYPAPHPGRFDSRPMDKHPPAVRPNGGPAVATTESRPSPDSVKIDEPSADEDMDSYDLPNYDAEVPLGQKYVIAVSGFFCKICHKFYNSESSAKVTHCKSKTHYEKFAKWVADKKEEALAQKRAAPPPPAPVPAPSTSSAPGPVSSPKNETVEPPAKVPKIDPPAIVPKVEPPDTITRSDSQEFGTGLVVKEEVNGDSDHETPISPKYDPSNPTAEDPAVSSAAETIEVVTSASEGASDADKPGTSSGNEGFLDATLYNFRKMRVQQLKENLKSRNLPLHGLKPLLLKRLEKALLAEAAEAAAAENEESQVKDEEQEQIDQTDFVKEEFLQAEELATQEPKAEGVPPREIKLTMHESDIEVSNKKSQWITERELERELLQFIGVKKVVGMERSENKMGKKTIVEWAIVIEYSGEFPSDGLNFDIMSHQCLPFRAAVAEET